MDAPLNALDKRASTGGGGVVGGFTSEGGNSITAANTSSDVQLFEDLPITDYNLPITVTYLNFIKQRKVPLN